MNIIECDCASPLVHHGAQLLLCDIPACTNQLSSTAVAMSWTALAQQQPLAAAFSEALQMAA